MKHIFLLDENIILFSETLKNEKGEDDFSSHSLIANIVQNCHRIALNIELRKRYQKIFDKIKVDSSRSSATIKMIEHIRCNSEKHVWRDYTSPIQNEDKLPEDDIPIVRLTVATKAKLVSCDNRLKKAIEQSGIDKDYGLECIRPKDALKWAIEDP